MKLKVLVIGLLATGAFAASAASLATDTYHTDYRETAKVQFDPAWHAVAGATAQGTAEAFLQDQATRYALPSDLGNLMPSGERESLLARHVTFQQMLNGLPVEGAEFIVSVSKRDGHVMRIFNNTYPVGENATFLPRGGMDAETAYDIAWGYLGAYGDLRSLPAAKLVYTPEGESFRLNWLVDLDLDGPDGAWRCRIDAVTGQIVEVTDTAMYRQPVDPVEVRLSQHQGPLADRQAAFARITELEAKRAAMMNAAKSRVNGTGLVFDPDPRTTLINNNLQDNSPASAFTNAYFTEPLMDIEFDGSVYRLNGPWVNIINFETPNTAPSTTPDGNWNRARGDNSFDDAMVYFQLDKSQRYMQDLGFVGAMGIQDGSIGTDTDGLSGADNSHYLPGSNRLAFGHGCVDDDEDADVIWHEYGHAIDSDINHNWSGGDTGAMGEGWGDYWGGSYSYSTPNGPTFFPNYIYSWDGHGNGNQCWPGRILNANGAQYVHTTFYPAHVSIPGGYQSDELWSTPLFQSLITLVGMGETRESVDSILLESKFGLGSGLKMRDMANVIIATAQAMEPGGPHAGVFVQKFLVHNIILEPLPAVGVASFAVTSEPSGNGAADPGETVDVQVTLANSGLAGATAVSAVLSTSTPGVTVVQDTANYPDLPVNGQSTSTVDYTVTVDGNVACGTLMAFSLAIDYQVNGVPASVTRSAQLYVGVPLGGYGVASPNTPVPDNDGNQVVSTITISGTGATVDENLNLDVNILHDYIGDLIVRLVSPQGTSIFLTAFQGGSADNIIGNYPNTLTPAQPLSTFLGQPLDGDWQLIVRDQGNGGTGTLVGWALYDISGFECDGAATATPDALPTAFGLAQNAPNPFNPSTQISFSVPADAGVVSLTIFDVRGQRVRTLEHAPLVAGQYTRTWDGRDDHGLKTSSGTYFYRLSGKNFTETRKMVIVQ